jgi:hypothetical protein
VSSETPKGFSYTINGRTASTADSTPTGRQILSDAGFEPADDFILIARATYGSKVVSLDEVINVESSAAVFFAFEGGKIFELTVNDHSIFWGKDKIKIEEIRSLGNVPDTDDLIWERDTQAPEVLPEHGDFSLRGEGVEHLRTKTRPPVPSHFVYFVDNVEYKTEHESLTGAQIIAKVVGWNPENSLVLEGEGSDPDEVIRPTTTVIFKGRATPAHFISVPPATFGGS